jgi:hypothetical protein
MRASALDQDDSEIDIVEVNLADLKSKFQTKKEMH